MKILILGHKRHGKDTIADILFEEFGLTHATPNNSPATKTVCDKLKVIYGYESIEECFEDRVHHRSEWYNIIKDYNTPDKARLAKEILLVNDVYVGMRDIEELEECKKQKIFDVVLTVIVSGAPLEHSSSMNIDVVKESDYIIYNDGTLEDLKDTVLDIYPQILADYISRTWFNLTSNQNK